MKEFYLKIPVELADDVYCNGCQYLVWHGSKLCTCTDTKEHLWAGEKNSSVPRPATCRLVPVQE